MGNLTFEFPAYYIQLRNEIFRLDNAINVYIVLLHSNRDHNNEIMCMAMGVV
jgi:hypothetical protein